MGRSRPHVFQASAAAATDRAGEVATLGAGGGASGTNIDRASEDDIWVVDGKPGMPTALLAWSGHDEHWPGHAHTLADAHAAAHDAQARLTLMDEVVVHANLIFPNTGGSR